MDSAPEESVIELYGDRAVQVSAKGKTVIHYRQADFLLESADLIVLGGQGKAIAWRAEDMEPAGAQLVLSCLTWAVRPGYFRRDGMFTPWAAAAAAWCRFFPAGKRFGLTATLAQEDMQSFGGLCRRVIAGRLPYFLPALLLLAGQLAMALFLTPYILLDFAIYTGVVLAVTAGLGLVGCGVLYTVMAAGSRTVQLAFTLRGWPCAGAKPSLSSIAVIYRRGRFAGACGCKRLLAAWKFPGIVWNRPPRSNPSCPFDAGWYWLTRIGFVPGLSAGQAIGRNISPERTWS